MGARDVAAVYNSMVWSTAAPLVGCFTCSLAEGMQIGPEQEAVPLAEGDAQSPQRALDDPHPLGDAPAVGGEAPQKNKNCMLGGALATI